MCAPIAIAAIGLGLSAYGAYAAGDSQKKALSYNAEIEGRAAADALSRGASEAAHIKEGARRIVASQVASTAAGGFDTSVGTPLDLAVETTGYGELDALTTINNSQRVASGRVAQMNLDKYQGRAAGRAGSLNATGSLFTGSAGLMKYYGNKSEKKE